MQKFKDCLEVIAQLNAGLMTEIEALNALAYHLQNSELQEAIIKGMDIEDCGKHLEFIEALKK